MLRAPRRPAAGLTRTAGEAIPGWLFVYGSLAGPAASVPGARVAQLTGLARGWGVAMDNRVDLPGYKYYTEPDGWRPAVRVAFADVRRADAGSATIGVLRPVDAGELDRLDARERNYERIRVDGQVRFGGTAGDVPGPVWAYVGTAAARERFAEGPTVIHGAYLREVIDGFAVLGPEVVAAVRDELAPGPLPVRELVRHDLPPMAVPERGRKLAV